MKKEHVVFLSVMFLAVVLCCINHFDYSADVSSNNTTLDVSALKCDPVERWVYDIRTEDYFKGYNETTVEWLSGLKGMKVFSSDDYYVVMSEDDAGKLPVGDAADVIINDIFTCEIMENRSLGDSYNDVLYVRNVEFVNQSFYYFDV
ncbi:MAG: hypothetical protein BZ135_07855 [Methanosphaera sp. rholeuAM6]|nr:MAG: hypothetical protein BZ135_07855 [Methanosphaera sp. rholeuAM6]